MTRVGVVGCGYWGPNVIRNFTSLHGCDLRAVCDVKPRRLVEIERLYPGVRTLSDFDDLVGDPEIDAVAICTPLNTHFPLARAALAAGKHVLVEKPMTDTVEHAEKLIQLAESRGLTLQVDHTFLCSGAVRKLRSIIDSGEIGELLYFDAVRVNLGLFQSDTNVLWDLAPHDLSIMCHLIDRAPIWVSAVGTAPYGSQANLAYVTIMFEGDLIAHLHVNWLAPVKLRSTLIGGSKRMIVYDDLAPSEKVRIYNKGVTLNGDRSARAAALVDYRVGDMFAPHIDKTEPLQRICHEFLDAIETGTHPTSDAVAGLQVVRLLEAAQRSMDREGERIPLDVEV